MSGVTLSNDQAFTAAICTLRYALGRMSYVVQDAAFLVRTLWPALTEAQRRVIVRELEEAVEADSIQRAEGPPPDGVRMGRLGMDMDREVWILLLGWTRRLEAGEGAE